MSGKGRGRSVYDVEDSDEEPEPQVGVAPRAAQLEKARHYAKLLRGADEAEEAASWAELKVHKDIVVAKVARAGAVERRKAAHEWGLENGLIASPAESAVLPAVSSSASAGSSSSAPAVSSSSSVSSAAPSSPSVIEQAQGGECRRICCASPKRHKPE